MTNKAFSIIASLCATTCFAADMQLEELGQQGNLQQQTPQPVEAKEESKRTISIHQGDGKTTVEFNQDRAKKHLDHSVDVAGREIDRAIDKAPGQLNTAKEKVEREANRFEKKHRGKIKKIFGK